MRMKRKAKRKGRSKSISRLPIPEKVMPTFTVLTISLICALGIASWGLWLRMRHQIVALPLPYSAPLANGGRLRLASLQDLLAISSEDLQRADIAVMNLLAAEGLPGTNGLDTNAFQRTLDDWAIRVKGNTGRHLYRLTDVRYADHYHHSEIYLRCELLLQTLQEDCGVHYDPALVDVQTGLSKQWAFTDTRNFFLNGVLGPNHAGSCSSMPVLYVAVGRRLGYPLKLVVTADHLFARWDDGVNRLNIEGSGSGFSSFPDEYYKTWPRPVSDREIAMNGYLRSLSPQEELGLFLSMRGHCLADTGQPAKAQQAYALARQYAPHLFPAGAGIAHSTAGATEEFLNTYRRQSQQVVTDALARQGRRDNGIPASREGPGNSPLSPLPPSSVRR